MVLTKVTGKRLTELDMDQTVAAEAEEVLATEPRTATELEEALATDPHPGPQALARVTPNGLPPGNPSMNPAPVPSDAVPVQRHPGGAASSEGFWLKKPEGLSQNDTTSTGMIGHSSIRVMWWRPKTYRGPRRCSRAMRRP